MRALKALVIVMGVLIIAGIALVGYTIVKRAVSPAAPAKPAVSIAIPPAPPIAGSAANAPYGPVEIPVPPDARILRTHAEGGRLLVELDLAGGGERVLVIELSTGALIGSIDLKPSK